MITCSRSNLHRPLVDDLLRKQEMEKDDKPSLYQDARSYAFDFIKDYGKCSCSYLNDKHSEIIAFPREKHWAIIWKHLLAKKKRGTTNLIKISQCIFCVAVWWFSQWCIHFLNKVAISNKCRLCLINQILFIPKKKQTNII